MSFSSKGYITKMPILFAMLLPSGCIIDMGPGPDLGECAEYPEGTYTYGEIGIGTCLSGPTDLRFISNDSGTYLAVSNADPFLNFGQGSTLIIDFDSIDFTRPVNYMHEVNASALAMDNYIGGLGLMKERNLLLATSRYSENAETRDQDDTVFVLDVSEPMSPKLWSAGSTITVADDPQPVVVHGSENKAYVLNITDHSISVIDTSPTPLEVVEVAPAAKINQPKFLDADDSGSVATGQVTMIDHEYMLNEHWYLSWVEGTFRLWLETKNGLERHTSGGADWVPSSLGIEVDPTESGEVEEVTDPAFYLFEDIPGLMFSDRGAIRSIFLGYSFDGQIPIGGFEWDSQEALLWGSEGAWDALLAGPAPLNLNDNAVIYYDGRKTEGADASIGMAEVTGDTFVRYDEPVLLAPAGYSSIEQPFVMYDGGASSYKMWMTMRANDGSYRLGTSDSLDGYNWSTPVEVISTAGDIAGPVVSQTGGRYLLWASQRTDQAWSTVTAWSYDGKNWFDLLEVISGDASTIMDKPPRPALQAQPTGAWRIEGNDHDPMTELVIGGAELVTAFGYSLNVATGFEIGADAVADDGSANGLEVDSFLYLDGEPTLYVSGLSAEGVPSISALQKTAGHFTSSATDLIPDGTGGNTGGATSPVVYESSGGYTMLYTAIDGDGVGTMRMATSNDGLNFNPIAGSVVEPVEFDVLTQLPHSIQVLNNGNYRLWYAGDSGTRRRIGSLLSTDGGNSFSREFGVEDDWQLGTGSPGDFDDSSVDDPVVVYIDGTAHLYYSGFDGVEWKIGHATRPDDFSSWEVVVNPITGEAVPELTGAPGTFSTSGTKSPVIFEDQSGDTRFWYTGFDGLRERVGEGSIVDTKMFENQRYPTLGDSLEFTTEYGGEVTQVIELAQTIESFVTSGIGAVSLTLDDPRGFLYVTSKLTDYIYVIDVRDDSTSDFQDANYLDIEALLLNTSLTGSIGFRDVIIVPDSDLLYLSGRLPDAVVAFDISALEDNATKETYKETMVAALPVKGSMDDAGEDSIAQIGVAGMALARDGKTLFASHYNENSLTVFDLSLGAWGTEVALVSDIGENPHVVRLSPDGKFAVVANYVGKLTDNTASSSLAIVDIDPSSDTYLDIVTWLQNR